MWDIQRGLLLRSWNRELIPNHIQSKERKGTIVCTLKSSFTLGIVPDQKRPDRLWCFNDKGAYTILNAVTGKLEVPWKFVFISEIAEDGAIYYASSTERILTGRSDGDDWIITGYSRNLTDLEGVFEFSLNSDLLKEKKSMLKSVCTHPDQSDLIALILKQSVLIVKVSNDHWKPEILLLPDEDCDSIQWGPIEDDPISGEKGCKVVLIDKETKCIKLYTLTLTGV